MTSYERAKPELLELVTDTMEQYHGGLSDAGVAIDVLLAYATRDKNDDPTGPALKDRGLPARAQIRVTNLKERALGIGDAVMLLDGDHLDEWSEAETVAIIDHELTHLELNPEKRDDLDRPKLKTRPHDFLIGGFEGVVRRHGEDSGEVQQVIGLFADRERRQMLLPGFVGSEPVGQADESEVSDEDAEADDEADAVSEEYEAVGAEVM